jgi:hypothetical protein
MHRYLFAAALGVEWLVWAVAVVLLLARRRRAPRAVGLAIPLVATLALLAAYMPIRLTTGWREPQWLTEPLNWGRQIVALTAWVALPVIAMIDRPIRSRDGE